MSLQIFRVGTRAAVAIAPNFPTVLQCRGLSMEKKRKRHFRHQDEEEMKRYQEEVREYNKQMKELRKKYAAEVAEIRENKAKEIQYVYTMHDFEYERIHIFAHNDMFQRIYRAAKLEDFRQQYLRAQVKAQIKEQNLKEHQRRIEEAYKKRLCVRATKDCIHCIHKTFIHSDIFIRVQWDCRRLVKAENREEAKKWEAMCDHRRTELIRIMTEESENWVAEDRIEEVNWV